MRYETATSLVPDEALAEATHFFGEQFGLTVGRQTARTITFEGGGGHVAVSVLNEAPTTLELETREWDAAVHEFMQALPR